MLLNYIGGSRDVGLAALPEEEIIAEVDKGCRQVLLKADAPKPKVRGGRTLTTRPALPPARSRKLNHTQRCLPQNSQTNLPPPLPSKVLGLKIWPTAIPQYELGHLDLIADLEKAEAEVPGLVSREAASQACTVLTGLFRLTSGCAGTTGVGWRFQTV